VIAAQLWQPTLRSISVDSWAVDYVPLDAQGVALRSPYAYRDPRTNGRLAQAVERLGGADALYARTGTQFMDINTLPQVVADLADEPELVARTTTRLLIADYFLYRLSGEQVAERTIASSTQLFDVRAGAWAGDVIEGIGDNVWRWPRIVEPGTILGALSPGALSGTRHAAPRVGAPVIVATCSHDTAAAVAVVPAESTQPWAYISSGTWSLVGVERAEPMLTDAARVAGFTNEAGLDGTVRLLKNRTGMWVVEECLREWSAGGGVGSGATVEALVAAAAQGPSAERTIDLNGPAFLERGDMPAKIAAACRARRMTVPHSRGGLVRLVIDSLAESYRRTIAELDTLTGTGTQVVHVVGGGARNALLNQLTADVCGRRVVAGPDEATVLGNLLVQARALGDLEPGVALRDVVRASVSLTTYAPGDSREASFSAAPGNSSFLESTEPQC
jgi:rhamnulokinase